MKVPGNYAELGYIVVLPGVQRRRRIKWLYSNECIGYIGGRAKLLNLVQYQTGSIGECAGAI